MHMNEKKMVMIIAAFILATPLAYSDCCLNKDYLSYYCEGSDTVIPFDSIGAEQCCGIGVNSCNEWVSGVCLGPSGQDECNNPVLGCCCYSGESGVNYNREYCLYKDGVFDETKNTEESCFSFCSTLKIDTATCSDMDMTASPIKGEKKIEIKITGCTPLSQYTLERNDINGSNPVTLRPPSRDTSQYIDSSVEWDKKYQYDLIIGGKSQKKIVITPGNIECMRRGDEKFCLQSSYHLRQGELQSYPPFNTGDFEGAVLDRIAFFGTDYYSAAVSCDADNQIKIEEQCRTGFCTIDNDQVACLTDSNCQNASSQNPFGMYYDKQTCETNQTGSDKYCFFDKSRTTEDYCYNCNPSMTCEDYKSQNACEDDHCRLNKCGWNQTNAELATGVCMNKESGENCEWCKKEGTASMQNLEAFNKVFDACTIDKARALSTPYGACFYKSGSASTCKDMTCSGYGEDMKSCGTTSPIINEYNQLTTPSNDFCGIGYCNWFVAGESGSCQKDADRAGGADCTRKGDSCEKDYFPPRTEIIPAKLNKGCAVISRISIMDKTSYDDQYKPIPSASQDYTTYVCSGAGCIGTLFNIQAKSTNTTELIIAFDVKPEKVTMNLTDKNGKNLLALKDGDNIIYFYTKDKSGNIGQIKNTTIQSKEECEYILYTALIN